MIAKLSPSQRAAVDSFRQRLGGWPVNPQTLDTICIPFLAVLKKYDIKNGNDLKTAMEKELWNDATGRNSDTTERRPNPNSKLEMLDYYDFNVTSSGWTNVDWCASVPSEKKALFTASKTDTLEGVMKVIYTMRRSVAQANALNNRFGYRYAINEDARWIFIGISVTNGKPVMEYGKLSDRNIDIKLTPPTVTVSEIATQLKTFKNW